MLATQAYQRMLARIAKDICVALIATHDDTSADEDDADIGILQHLLLSQVALRRGSH